MTIPNEDAPEGESSVHLSIDDVLIELQEQISSLSAQLAMAKAQIRGLNREIATLRQKPRTTKRTQSKGGAGV